MNHVISAWSDLSGGIPIRSVVDNCNRATISYGTDRAIGELDLDRPAMRTLAKLAADALIELDEHAERERASWPRR